VGGGPTSSLLTPRATAGLNHLHPCPAQIPVQKAVYKLAQSGSQVGGGGTT
jgi:hypothetical protein